MWHLRSLTCTSVFEAPKVCHQHVMFYEDEVSIQCHVIHIFHISHFNVANFTVE